MIDLGISKMALIGVVALIVIGPEKLPRVARTVGALLGKAQRYVADVKAEVNRAMDLEDLKKMKESVESTAQEMESSMREGMSDLERNLQGDEDRGLDTAGVEYGWSPPPPSYKRPEKNWRIKRGATPKWYKSRAGVRTHVQSGAARLAKSRAKGH